jgi:DNA-binding LacI/PurR family transcriptional regulator
MTQEIEIPNIGMTFSREIMPQIKRDQMNGFLKFLDNKGISYSKSLLDTGKLKSTQSDFDKDKIITMMMERTTKPIIVSNDDYVLDGHHRWLADHNKKIRKQRLGL